VYSQYVKYLSLMCGTGRILDFARPIGGAVDAKKGGMKK
jgi:hypothetical protein